MWFRVGWTSPNKVRPKRTLYRSFAHFIESFFLSVVLAHRGTSSSGRWLPALLSAFTQVHQATRTRNEGLTRSATRMRGKNTNISTSFVCIIPQYTVLSGYYRVPDRTYIISGCWQTEDGGCTASIGEAITMTTGNSGKDVWSSWNITDYMKNPTQLTFVKQSRKLPKVLNSRPADNIARTCPESTKHCASNLQIKFLSNSLNSKSHHTPQSFIQHCH